MEISSLINTRKLRYIHLTENITNRDLSTELSGQGLVQIFTGDGKGKTSAALGCIIRALGHGLRVFIVFFMKGDYPYGERQILSKLPDVTVASYGDDKFVDPTNIKLEQIAEAGQALAAAREAMLSGKYDLIILDEVNVAAAFKLVSVDDILQLIRDKPKKVDLILTGRKADPKLVQAADLVTEMIKIKHPYDKGMTSRKGFDY
jgi:cob(I)alamin adenosyltransferase